MSQTAKLTAFLARNSKHLIFHARLQDNITSCGLQQLECNYTSGDQICEKMFIANLSCLIRMKISGLGLIKLNVHVVSNSAGIIECEIQPIRAQLLAKTTNERRGRCESIRELQRCVIWKRDNAGSRQNWLSGAAGPGVTVTQ